jgi:hypothetical protein
MSRKTSLRKPILPPLTNGNPFVTDFYTDEELAQNLRVTTRTLRRWHDLRFGPPRTVLGRKILYRKESVIGWLIAREEKPLARRQR